MEDVKPRRRQTNLHQKTMRQLKHKYYYDNVYRMAYVFILNVLNDEQVKKILKAKYPETWKFYKKESADGDLSIEGVGGKCIQGDHRQIIMVKKQTECGYWPAQFYAALAHECLHATFHTFRARGVKYDDRSHNEHFTYYLDHLIAQAIEKK